MGKLVNFLAGGSTLRMMGPQGLDPAALRELLPFLPAVATQASNKTAGCTTGWPWHVGRLPGF